jgi:transcriptional regulator with XRE-family HTH domain
MNELQGIPPKFARQLALARKRLTVADEVGLALRDHRRALGLSQRAYAASRGLSRAMLARLEAGAGRMSLDTVVAALDGTGFELRVTFDDPPPTTPGAAEAVPSRSTSRQGSGPAEAVPSTSAAESGSPEDVRIPPQAWLATDLVARVRGGSRRFPAHRVVIPVTDPPMWWWIHEFFSGPTEKPQWYAPQPAYDPFANWESCADDPSSGAA